MQPPRFKFYIHDSVEACRLQLIGPFTLNEVKELEGCWNTARTTLAKRKLIVDLSALSSIDHEGRKWIAVMIEEGAILIEQPPDTKPRSPKTGLLKRLLGMSSDGSQPVIQQYVGSPECEK